MEFLKIVYITLIIAVALLFAITAIALFGPLLGVLVLGFGVSQLGHR